MIRLGTLAPTILFGVVGVQGMKGPSTLLLVAGIFFSLFDLIYIGMLLHTKGDEKRGESTGLSRGLDFSFKSDLFKNRAYLQAQEH